MLIYFSRPHQLYKYKYTEFFNKYVIANVLPARYKNRPYLLNEEYYELKLPHSSTVKYICQRKSPEKVIVRMEMCYINHGEIFYFRLILLKRPVINEIDALTDQHGIRHETFQQDEVMDYTDDNAFIILNDSINKNLFSLLEYTNKIC